MLGAKVARLTAGPRSETLPGFKGLEAMRLQYLAVLAGLGVVLAVTPAGAGERTAQPVAAAASATDFSSQARPRRVPRIRVTRQAGYLPPDAVRDCRAWYVQEYRPSGTVITPRMQCWWTR